MDAERLLSLVPHYIAMLLLAFLVLGVVRATVGDLGFWIEFAIVGVIVFTYRPVVTRLGVAPSAWDSRSRSR